MRSEVAAKLAFACQSAACAPPPVGTGGSTRGSSSRGRNSSWRDYTAEDYDSILPTDVRAWRPSTRLPKGTSARTPSAKRRVKLGVASKLRKAMKKLDPASIKATPANPKHMGWVTDTHRGRPAAAG